jgi:hypothetical protein
MMHWRWVAVGIALVSSRAFAEPAVESKVTLGGYLETYYAINLRTPSNRITNLRGFDDRDRTFTIANVALDAKGERGPLTVHAILQVGSTPTSYYGGDDVFKYIQTVTLAYKLCDATIEAGLFPSPIGPEVFAIKDNWNWSRSNLFFGLPFYHTGARVSYPLGGGWTGTLHVYNGWNTVVDNNATPSVTASAAYASDKVNGQILYFGGIERDDWRHLLDVYATVTVSPDISLLAQADAGFERTSSGTASWFAAALYGKLALSPKLYVATRADVFREWVPTGVAPIFWPTSWIASGTATLALQPVDGVSVRLEVRHDHAADDVFFGGTVEGDGVTTPFVPNRRQQDTVTLGATAWF